MYYIIKNGPTHLYIMSIGLYVYSLLFSFIADIMVAVLNTFYRATTNTCYS